MKSTKKIVGVIVATLLLCFAIGLVTKSLSSTISNLPTNTKKEHYTSIVSPSFVLQYSQNENVTDASPSVTSTVFKNPFLGYFAATIATEHLIKNTFSNYIKRSEKTLVHYRKTDIIFPFHYFW